MSTPRQAIHLATVNAIAAAAQAQAEPVNQQLLALVKSFGHKTGCAKNAFGEQCTCGVDEAITAAEQVTLCASCARANVDCPIYPQQTASCVEYRPAAQQQAEPVALSLPFFAYDSETGFERFATEAKAKTAAQESIDTYREEAGEGWAEAVENICWGVVLGTTREVALPDEYSGGNGLADDMKPVDYVLTDAAQPPAVAVPDGLLTADDMEALQRFAECCEDFESGGHDVPKAAMKRLELAGAVRSCGFGRHETTLFGDAMLAAAPQGVDSSVQVADEKECLHHFVMFRNECMKCGQPYDAAQKGGEA